MNNDICHSRANLEKRLNRLTKKSGDAELVEKFARMLLTQRLSANAIQAMVPTLVAIRG